MSRIQRFEVLIVGAGPSGLYAALMLTSMGISVRLIDKGTMSSPDSSPILLSPHTLEQLDRFDVTRPLVDKGGTRHMRLQMYMNGKSAERQSHRVWETNHARYTWSMACDSSTLCAVLRDTLEQCSVHEHHELVQLQDTKAIDPQELYPIVATVKDLKTNRVSCWRARIVIDADGSNSTVRRLLGIGQSKPFITTSSMFCTVTMSAETNFPGARAVSIIQKGRSEAALVFGHRDQISVILQQKPEWGALDDHDKRLRAIFGSIKALLQPYDIKLRAVTGYRQWAATDTSSDMLSVDGRYFLVGSAAQTVCPRELLAADLGFDQVANLCWKLSFYLKGVASAHILDTFELEARSRAQDYMAVSKALIAALRSGNPKDIALMKRNKSWFIGTTPYPENLTCSPSKGHDAFSFRAPNSKLKPYTAAQLVFASPAQTISCSNSSTTSSRASRSAASVDENRLVRSRSFSSLSVWSQRAQSLSGVSLKTATSKTSYKKNDNNADGAVSSWIKSNIAKIKARGYQHYDPDSVVKAPHADRWRQIKATPYYLLDQVMPFSEPPCFFAILVFCGTLADAENLRALQKLRHYLDSPASFVTQFERYVHQPPQQQRSSSSTTTSSSRLSRLFFPWTNRTPSDSSHSSSNSNSSRLFRFLYITSSDRRQVAQYLDSTASFFFSSSLASVYLDHDHQSHSAYAIEEPTVVVVRPDGYVGVRARIRHQLHLLTQYFERFLVLSIDLDTAVADVANDFY